MTWSWFSVTSSWHLHSLAAYEVRPSLTLNYNLGEQVPGEQVKLKFWMCLALSAW